MGILKNVIVIAGPTAVGKTAVALDVAKQLDTEIISADSRQCYKELAIGVARPSTAELAQVPHHFIASHSITQKVTAAVFEQYALEKAYGLLENLDTVVLTGGTGLYIKAFCEGLDAIPEVPEDVHQQVVDGYETFGLEWLQQQVRIHDPLFFSRRDIQNPHRLMRALEVYQATGRSIETYQTGTITKRDFNIIKIALGLPKEALHHNIDSRVDNMLTAGLIDEVKSLMPFKHFNALQTVGYKEIFDYLEGKISLEDAVALIKKNTRLYAKRQGTWFRKDVAFTWLPPAPSAVLQFLKNTYRLPI